MKKLFIFSVGLVLGFFFEFLNLTEFYSIFLPKNYVNANSSLFLFVYPLLIIIVIVAFMIFIKNYPWMWLMIGFFSGFLLCIMGFMALLGLGGGV